LKKKMIDTFQIKTKIGLSAAISLFVLFGLTAVWAQDQQPKKYEPPKQTNSEPAPPTGSLVISPDEDYLIGPSDVLEIRVEDAPELSSTFRLNSKGTFLLPVVGTIETEKKTTEEVAKFITEKLRAAGYLVNPIVNVSVKQSNSRAFFIQGAVRRPGIYQIEGRPSLLKLITIAGGLADNYGSTAFVMREKKHAGKSKEIDPAVVDKTADQNETDKTVKRATATTENESEDSTSQEEGAYDLLKANINNLLRGNLDQNIAIEAGDIVHIPQSDIFFVAGEVKSPGSFPLKEGTTLRQAISLAQGTNFEGNLDQSVIFREDQLTGKRQEIKVDVAGVMAGKKDDVDIMANDIIIVPNSKKKAVAKSLLKTISGGLPRLLFGF
jgi:polysaccharide export outer membrane protein